MQPSLDPRTRDAIARHLDHAVAEEALIDALAQRAAQARVVLIGEASHGTHEFYHLRAALTRRLIANHGFDAVACEADWPDAYRVNRFVHGHGEDEDARQALLDFHRFPRWMWRNQEVADFVDWLHAINQERPADRRIGFYGLDLYAMHAAIDAVLDYLEREDPLAAERAREAFACLDHVGIDRLDPQHYGFEAAHGMRPDCARGLRDLFHRLNVDAADRLDAGGLVAADAHFAATMNARLVADAEAYYRLVHDPRVSSWNLRDHHMYDVLQALDEHLGTTRERLPRLVVWAHNSHVGDARASEMGGHGEITLGQLVRERWRGPSWHLGFTTDHGSVIAADRWGGEAESMTVRPARDDSHEGLLHAVGAERCLVPLDDPDLRRAFGRRRLERAIGVIYRPTTERASHYFHSRLAERYDAVVHIDRTRALTPLDRLAAPTRHEPQTWPSGR